MKIGADARGCDCVRRGLTAMLAAGVVFGLAPTRVWATGYMDIYSFSNAPSGWEPYGGMILAKDGNFYGATVNGGTSPGPYGDGTVFKMTPAHVVTVLHNFTGAEGNGPEGSLIQGTDGNFYGASWSGGVNGEGNVFKMTPAGVVTNVHSFDGTDGWNTYAGVVQASDGFLYGVMYQGGAHSDGTIFKVSTDGTIFADLHDFSGTNADGASPYAQLMEGPDGNLWGTTWTGGANNVGTIYKITKTGSYTTVHSFNTSGDGYNPFSGLALAADGNMYGTTYGGGANGIGTIYRISPNGTYSTAFSFPGGLRGSYPEAPLIVGRDGNLFGAAQMGGTAGKGLVFEFSTAGEFAALGSPNGATGADPFGGLVTGADGNLYGVCYDGGPNGSPNGDGAIYEVPMPAHHELLLENSSSRQVVFWSVNGRTANGGPAVATIPPVGWSVVAGADFNDDGQVDLLLENNTTRGLAIWYLDGSTLSGSASVGTVPVGWRAIATGDFNGDGHTDILFEYQSTHQLAIWYLNGSHVIGQVAVSMVPPSGWTAVGVADFDGDGHPDILFQNNSTYALAVWFMNNSTVLHGVNVTTKPPSGWRVVGCTSVSGRVEPDVILQNSSTGQIVEWELSDLTLVGGGHLSLTPPVSWTVVGPR